MNIFEWRMGLDELQLYIQGKGFAYIKNTGEWGILGPDQDLASGQEKSVKEAREKILQYIIEQTDIRIQ